MYMLTNVNSHLAVGSYGALNVISWKYTFKRLNEEYELAKKKKQALDNLFETGRISQATRDSFAGDISSAIAEIEKQRQDLAEKMQAKTQDLENQLKTLENLLANYEIQHVVGEIDEEIYAREINLLANSLETTRNELGVIKQATDQLFPPAQPTQELIISEPAAPVAESTIAQPAVEEAVPLEVPIEEVQIEPTIVEPAPVEQTPIETPPVEDPIETMQVDVASVEAAPLETPIEAAPEEAAPIEADSSAPIDIIQVENLPMETIAVETTPEENVAVETSLETPTIDEAPVEEVTIISTEPEAQIMDESTPELVITEEEVQEQFINIETATPIEDTPQTEESTEAAVPEQPVVDVPLQVFEVTEPEPVETTLEKLMEPEIELLSEPIMVEEAHVPAHPSEAPQQAPSEVTTETDSDQDIQTEENEENTTE